MELASGYELLNHDVDDIQRSQSSYLLARAN